MRLSAPIFRLKRQARLLARQTAIPLHEALDEIARGEGFQSWSHLSALMPDGTTAAAMMRKFRPGDLILLGARPAQGKTILALQIAVEAAAGGKRAYVFSIEDSQRIVNERVAMLGADPDRISGSLSIDTSDHICADHIISRMREASAGDVAVIDFLQLLDQRRQNPVLAEQVGELKRFAARSGAIVIALSQIDRSFDPDEHRMPKLSDVRMPNPVDLTLFTKACFIHAGEVALHAVA